MESLAFAFLVIILGSISILCLVLAVVAVIEAGDQ